MFKPTFYFSCGRNMVAPVLASLIILVSRRTLSCLELNTICTFCIPLSLSRVFTDFHLVILNIVWISVTNH